MQYTLGIDTTSIELSVALVGDGKPVASVNRYIRNSHAEQIERAVGYLLSSSNIAVTDIVKAGIAIGPGSFTGLRIGISYLKGLLFMRSIPVLPVSSLETVANAAPVLAKNIVVAFEARQGTVFCARFTRSNNSLVRSTDDLHLPINELQKLIEPQDVIIIDSMGYAASKLSTLKEQYANLYTVEECLLSRGMATALYTTSLDATDARFTNTNQLEPQYMLPSYGESAAPQGSTCR